MKMVTGAILILTAEQAFAHAHLIGFPHQVFARETLIPVSTVAGLLGVGLVLWGIISERGSKTKD
jgi:hypothetical protein